MDWCEEQGVPEFIEVVDETLFIPGYASCLIGVTTSHIAVYDVVKIIELLQEKDGMTEEEAEEFFQYNIEGAYVGDYTPILMYKV